MREFEWAGAEFEPDNEKGPALIQVGVGMQESGKVEILILPRLCPLGM